jgi:hypothetical protein
MRYRVTKLNKISEKSESSEKIHSKHDLIKNNIESWNFEIRKVSAEDQGLYECYIKLDSKHKVKANINLIVLNERDKLPTKNKPRYERLSSSSVEKIHVLPSSRIKLRCNATGIFNLAKSTDFLSTSDSLINDVIQWYKGNHAR